MSVAAFAAMVVGTGAGLMPGAEPCELVANGSFDDGVRGWTILPIEQASGEAVASVIPAITDGTWYVGGDGLPFDHAVLSLSLLAAAGQQGGSGQAIAAVTAETVTTVTGRYLRVRHGGGFEFLFFGQAGYGLRAAIEVEAETGEIVGATLTDLSAESTPGCAGGLSILGTFDDMPPVAIIDLLPSNIGIGDTVTVRIVLEGAATAGRPCQSSETSALLLIDEVEFCSPNSGDVNGDGVVDVLDLAALIAAWGLCPVPPADCPTDVDHDGEVGVDDLVIVVTSWT